MEACKAISLLQLGVSIIMEPIKILMDDREPSSQMELAEIVGGIDFDRQRLKVGDYIHNNICIERKEINDFCASIMDGRLKSQIKKMKATYKHNFVIIIGHISDRTSQIHENCILGKITSLILYDKANILFCDNEFQFLYLMKSLFTKIDELES